MSKAIAFQGPEQEAYLIAGRLEAEGFDCEVAASLTGQPYWRSSLGQPLTMIVAVDEGDRDRAKQLIKEMNGVNQQSANSRSITIAVIGAVAAIIILLSIWLLTAL